MVSMLIAALIYDRNTERKMHRITLAKMGWCYSQDILSYYHYLLKLWIHMLLLPLVWANFSFYVISHNMVLLYAVMLNSQKIIESQNLWVPWEILFSLWPSVRYIANPSRSGDDLSVWFYVLLYLGCYFM